MLWGQSVGYFKKHWGHWFPCQQPLALHAHTRTHTERWSTNLSQHSCSFWSTQLPVSEPSTSTSCIFHASLSLLHFRLLSQLDETERAFDEFWLRHQTKLEQCLQLRHFEHNYREVSWACCLRSNTLNPYVPPIKSRKWQRCLRCRWGFCWIRCLRNLWPSRRWGSAQPMLTISSVSSPATRRESV